MNAVKKVYFRRKVVTGCVFILIITIVALELLIGTYSETASYFSSRSAAIFLNNNHNQLHQKQHSDKKIGQVAALGVFKREITKNCTPRVDPSNLKTPFKFFIYNLPSKFNTDVHNLMSSERQFSYCYNLDFCGTGEELYEYNREGKQLFSQGTQPDGIYSVRNTHQFALEVIIHYKLLHSPYRTADPDKADMFYIPAYTGLNCLTFRDNSEEFVDGLFQHLRTKEAKYFHSGKPHFSTLSKIQREQGSQMCTTLKHPDTKNITFIAIEKESNPYWARNNMYGNSIIVAPYPAYVHFINDVKHSYLFEYHSGLRNLSESKFKLQVPALSTRKVTLFLAAGTRRSNHFRAQLLDQFKIQTQKGPDEFLKDYLNRSTDGETNYQQIMLITRECVEDHRTTTIPWMRKSVFCLQPPGDSPTRKSIYDSILSGCIPIFISGAYKTVYPFERHLNYNLFSYTIEEKVLTRYNKTVFEIIQGINEEKRKHLFENLLHVAKWFQYSMPTGEVQWDDDAVTLIMDDLAHINGFSNDVQQPL